MDLHEVPDAIQRDLLILTLKTTAFEAPLFISAADLPPQFFPEGFQVICLSPDRPSGCKIHIDPIPFESRPDTLAQEIWRVIDPQGLYALPQPVLEVPLTPDWTRKTVAQLYHHYTDGRILAHRLRQISGDAVWKKLSLWNSKLQGLPQSAKLPELVEKAHHLADLGDHPLDRHLQWLDEMLDLLAPMAEDLHRQHFAEGD